MTPLWQYVVAAVMIGVAYFAIGAIVRVAESRGEARGRREGWNDGWEEACTKLRSDVQAAETIAQVALASAQAAREATANREEMTQMLQRAHGENAALLQSHADLASRIDVMDQDLRVIYTGFAEARIIRGKHEVNAGRQVGEPDASRGVPPLARGAEPKQN